MVGLKKLWKKGISKRKNLIISVVALIEVIMIACVSVFAWTETTSSLQIIGNGDIDTFTYTTANVGSGTSYNNKPIDLSQFVRKSGNLHFSLASSANGTDFYFPKVVSMGSTAAKFRKGNINDKNANYLEFSFDVKSVGAAKDFMFASAPTIKVGGATKTDNSVRIAISDGTTTKIYSNKTATDSVVATTTGTTANTAINAFTDYDKDNKNSLFSVENGATKRITVTIWLQYNANKNANYTGQEISIENFKIVPTNITRYIYLKPNANWKIDGARFAYYSWNDSGGVVWVNMTEVTTGVYRAEWPADGYTKIIFCRMNGGTTDNNWDNTFNQTSDLDVPGSTSLDNCYTVKEGTWDKGGGSWSVYSP